MHVQEKVQNKPEVNLCLHLWLIPSTESQLSKIKAINKITTREQNGKKKKIKVTDSFLKQSGEIKILIKVNVWAIINASIILKTLCNCTFYFLHDLGY